MCNIYIYTQYIYIYVYIYTVYLYIYCSFYLIIHIPIQIISSFNLRSTMAVFVASRRYQIPRLQVQITRH